MSLYNFAEDEDNIPLAGLKKRKKEKKKKRVKNSRIKVKVETEADFEDAGEENQRQDLNEVENQEDFNYQDDDDDDFGADQMFEMIENQVTTALQCMNHIQPSMCNWFMLAQKCLTLNKCYTETWKNVLHIERLITGQVSLVF